MPRARFNNADPEKKKKLLDAAMQEFAAHGYELASVNRILEAAGFSKGAFYYYFDDKADLAAAAFIAAAEPEAMVSDLRPPSSAVEFWAELWRMSHVAIQRMARRRVQYDCMARLTSAIVKDPVLTERVMPLFMPGRKKLAEFIARGVEVGAVRRDLPVEMLMSSMEAVKTAAYKSMFPGDHVPTDAEMEAFTDLVIDLGKRLISPPKEG